MATFAITSNEVSFFILLLTGVIYLLFVVGCECVTLYVTLLVIVIVLFVCFVLKRKELYFLWSIVAPRITGSAPILSNLLWAAREEGSGKGELNDLLRLDIPFMRPMFFIFKPSYLKRILSLEATNFASKGFTGVVTKLTGPTDNILMNEGPPNAHWARFREITSGVNRDRIGEHSALGVMFAESWKACQELTHLFDNKRGEKLDLFFALFNVMVPAHNRALFGEEFVSKHWYPTLGEDMYHIITENGKQLKFPYSYPLKERTMMDQIKRITGAVVKMAEDSNSPFILPWHDAVKKGQMTAEEFRSNLLIFEYAQAPLHVVFWVLYMLALHPDVEKRVVNEIVQVVSQGPVTYTRMSEFKYLSRVITETLRLFPGVGLMQVRFNKTDCMFGSHFVPEDSYIFLSPYIIHRNASFWENPDEFDPSREGLDTTHSGEDLIHIPFGYGPRQCQGQFFAQDFMKATLISLLQHHKINLVPGQKAVKPTEIGFCRPEYPAYFYFSERVLPPPTYTSVPNNIPVAARRSSLPPLASTRRASLPAVDPFTPRRSSLPPSTSTISIRRSVGATHTPTPQPNMKRRASLSQSQPTTTTPPSTPSLATTTTTPHSSHTTPNMPSHTTTNMPTRTPPHSPHTPSPLSLSSSSLSPPNSPNSNRKAHNDGGERRTSMKGGAELSEFSNNKVQQTGSGGGGEKEESLLKALAKRRRSTTKLPLPKFSPDITGKAESQEANPPRSPPTAVRRRRSVTTIRGMPTTYNSVYNVGTSRKQSKVAALRSKALIFRESFKSRRKSANATKNKYELLIIWGSQSGRSHSYALRLSHMAKLCKISCTCVCMSLCDVNSISKYKNIVIVTSTYGDGGPPENAETFCEWLEGEHPADMWRGVRYAVLSLGSSQYSLPFEFGNFVSRRFLELGAQKLVDDGKLDDQRYNENEEFKNWSLKMFEYMTSSSESQQYEKKSMKQALLVSRNKILGFGKFDFNLLNPPFELGFSSEFLAMESRIKYQENVVIAAVGGNKLVSADPTNQIYSINLKYPDDAIQFQPGDNIAVFPTNDIELVRRLIARLGYQGDLIFNVVRSVDDVADGDKLYCSLGENKCTLEIALSYYYDITQWSSKTLLQLFALNCTDENDQDILFGYASNFHAFLKTAHTPLDILEKFPSIQLRSELTSDDGGERNLAVFLGLLKPMKQRPYSVSNSPLVCASSVRLVYKVVEYAGNEGQVKHGLCSNWLKSRKSGDEVAISLSKSRFKLPANDDVPIIMIGAGTGISPYFGFLEHRLALTQQTAEKKFGTAVLIHGCRSEADFPYREALDYAIEAGVLTCMWPAYSRKEGVETTYVQHVIDRESAVLWQYINNEGAVIYSCGDIRIGISVRETFIQLAQKCGKLDEWQAKAYIQKLSSNGRLWHDEWGTSFSAQA